MNECSLGMDNLNEGVFIGQNYDSYGHIIKISRKQNTGIIWLWSSVLQSLNTIKKTELWIEIKCYYIKNLYNEMTKTQEIN